MVRVFPCVDPAGSVFIVASTTRLTFALELRAGRPRPGASSNNASTPPLANRLRHRISVGRFVPTLYAMRRIDIPCVAINVIRARKTMRWGEVPALIHPSGVLLASRSSSRVAADSHISMPSPSSEGTLLKVDNIVNLFTIVSGLESHVNWHAGGPSC